MFITMTMRKPLIPREVTIIPPAVLAALMADATAYAYTPGTIAANADPIIQIIRELADPCAYGVFIWACVRFILNQRPEAKEMMKSAAWGYFLVQMAPTFMGMLKDIR